MDKVELRWTPRGHSHGVVGQSGQRRDRAVPVAERVGRASAPEGGSRQWLLARVARLREHRTDDQHDTHDEPRNGIEMLIASARRGGVPASGARSIALYVCDEERQESRSCEQAEC
jgi:hypothetical protein